MGRPLKFSNPDTFDLMVDLYVATCEERKEPLTHVGLALHLGFCDRQSLYDYKVKEEFAGSVKRGMSIVEAAMAVRSCKNNAAGPIFLLKNMGYSDRHDVQIDPIQVTITGKDVNL